MLGPGITLSGRFDLLCLLGEGGFGSVWEALDRQTGCRVALKILHKQGASQHVRRLLREARVLLALRHPSIVLVEELFPDEEAGPLLVMELLQGETLRQRLLRDDLLEPQAAVGVLLAIAEGLQEAHRLGVVHRDIKPENVFLQTILAPREEASSREEVDGPCSGIPPTLPKAGQSRSIAGVKILDFGVVKLVTAGEDVSLGSSMLTRKGTSVGTAGYMAPEQLWGEEELDGRADLWALGAVAYESLSGAVPVVASTPNQFLFRLQEQGITPLHQVAPWLPPGLCALVDQMLAFSRGDRPRDAAEVVARLSAFR